MVLFAPIIKRRIEEKVRRETNAEWEAWLKRSDEAQAKAQPFDEPSPSQVSANNDAQ